ncbi:hypothetical protein ACWD04_00375 [Streptomyces sp. NPDC002911]
MSGPGDGSRQDRRISETAALVSAVAAVVGLLLAVFGVPTVGGSSVNRSIAEDAEAPASSSGPPPMTNSPYSPAVSATPHASRSAGPSPAATLPPGWRVVSAPALKAAFAVPGGWTRKRNSDIQSAWRSQDETHAMTVKRDSSYGPTAEAAAAGQLAWYNDSGESSMADLKVAEHSTRQNGQEALWLEIDYHWVRQSEPRKRVEVFVAGESGHVYQLLFDTVSTPNRLAEQQRMFATARSQLLIDRTQ